MADTVGGSRTQRVETP